MENIIKYIDCGIIANRSSSPAVDFLVARFSDIEGKIIPFLEKYLLQSVKQKDFKDFCKAAVLIGNKKHLMKEGLDEIKILKKGMNKGRLSSA